MGQGGGKERGTEMDRDRERGTEMDRDTGTGKEKDMGSGIARDMDTQQESDIVQAGIDRDAEPLRGRDMVRGLA